MSNSGKPRDLVPEVTDLIGRMADSLRPRVDPDWLMVGIHTGGVWIARELHRILGIRHKLAELDISFYRDDYGDRGMRKGVRPSILPASLDGRNLILVDDVLHTGRTVRAALDELFDYGRPARIILAALVDRGGRELPICPDVVGQRMDPGPGHSVRLKGPEPLKIVLEETAG